MENPEGCLIREGNGKASKARKSTVLLATKKPVKNSPLDRAINPYMPCQEQFDDTRSHGWRGKWELMKQSAGISSKKSGCGEVRGKSGTKEDRGSRKGLCLCTTSVSLSTKTPQHVWMHTGVLREADMTEQRGKGLKNTCKEVVSDAVWNLSCLGKQSRWAKGTEQKPGTLGTRKHDKLSYSSAR